MKTLRRIRIIACILLLMMTVSASVAEDAAIGAAQSDGAQPRPGSVTAEGILEISKHGNVKLRLSHAQVLEVFDYGDILTVSFGDTSVDVPLGKNYSDVDSGCPGLFLQMDGETEETELAVSMGDFAEAYGIAEKIVHEDKSYVWQYYDGMSAETDFTFTLKEKAGYLEAFTIRSMTNTNLREDYPALTDAEFANFRPVTVGEIGEGILFRSSSPVNPECNRSAYADAAAAAAGVTVFVDLTDTETSALEYEGARNSYFATQKYVAVAMSMDFTSAVNTEKLAEAFRFMAVNPGVYCVFCDAGKDRTGFMIAILECLMGAEYDEIAEDYMRSFVNYFKIVPTDAVYEMTLNGNLNKHLAVLLGVDPRTAELRQAAEKYLTSIGLTGAEIEGLKMNLSRSASDGIANH